MEPTDFDKILRDKLGQQNNSYEDRIEQAKPFVWDAIQENLANKRRNNHWMIAAASVLILIFSWGLFYFMQQQHQKELGTLTQQIQLLNHNYQQQFNDLAAANEALICELSTKQSLESSMKEESVQSAPNYVYAKDTVFIEQVKYITETIFNDTVTIQMAKSDSIAPIDNKELHQLIYPTFNTNKTHKAAPENIKIKIQSFASN